MDSRPAAAPAAADSAAPADMSLHVLATTMEGTTCALERAKRLTRRLNARVVLLVPGRRSRSVSLPPRNTERTAAVDWYWAAAAAVAVDATVLFCVCDRPDDVVRQMIGSDSLVIVGGRRCSWWPGREQRLVRRLTADGYPVLFVEVPHRRSALAQPQSAS